MSLTIFDRCGNLKAELSPNDSSVQSTEIQGDNVLSLSFRHYEHILLDVDDYVDFGDTRYWMCEKYRPTQISMREWEYNIKLYGIESLLRNILVVKRVDNENDPVFTLTAPPREHVAMIVNCMNDGMGDVADWKVGQVDGSENIVIDYFGKYCDEALREIAEKVGAEYWAEGQTVNVCRCEHGETLPIGYNNGLTGIEPDRADNVKFYTRLYPVGSSRNIDPEKYGYTRLQLPGGQKYVEINADKYGRVDHYEESAFADIYPRRTGTISSVRSEVRTGEDGNPFTIYYFSEENLQFDPNDYMIGGLVIRVSFQEGSELAGLGEEENGTYFFEVNFNSKTREFEIITIWPYDNDIQLPGDKLIPKVGDKYILWNLRMPDEYYTLAEEEFRAAVDKYNEEHALDITVFKATTDHVWIEDNNVDLFVGRRVRLLSEQYFPETGYRDSRITRITRKVNLPSQMDIEIGDAIGRTSKQKFTDDIADANAYARSIRESISLPDIIRTGDLTRPTDNNLFSARRSMQDFFSRLKDDRSKGKIASDIAIEVGDFLSGVSGAKIWKDAESGQTSAELDRLFVRVKAYFDSLTIINTESLAGEQRITPGAGIECTKVEELKNTAGVVVAYRCYFLAEQDGEKTETKIVAGDQAIAQTFNAKTGVVNNISNNRYWRLVTGVSNNAYTDDAGNTYGYIDLSATDCEKGSSLPKAGDKIVQFGNRNDRTRQAAMVFSTVDADAPSVKLFTGIGSGETNEEHYSLDGRDIVSYGYDAAKGRAFFNCYGNAYIGSRSGKTFVRFDEDEDELDIKAKIHVGSTIDGKTIDKYFSDKAEVATDPYKYLAKALPQNTDIIGGVMLSSLLALGYTDSNNVRHTLAGMNGIYDTELGGRTIGSWWGGPMVDLFDENDVKKNLAAGSYATSLIHMDGTGYFVDGLFRIKKTGLEIGDTANGYGISMGMDGRLIMGNGISINIGGSAQGLAASIESVTTLANKLSNLFTPYLGNTPKTWAEVSIPGTHFDSVRVNVGLWTDEFLSCLGKSDMGGSGGGGGGLVESIYRWADLGGTFSDTDNDTFNAYTLNRIYSELTAADSAISARLADYYTKSEADGRYALKSSLANYVTLNTEQTIKAYKNFEQQLRFVNTAPIGANRGKAIGIRWAAASDTASADTSLDIGSVTHTDADGNISSRYLYLGWGTSPWVGANCLAIGKDIFQYKGNDILHSNNYAAILDGRYVKKSGADTMTGPLTIQSGTDSKLIFNNTDGEKYTIISFREDGTEYSSIIARKDFIQFSGLPVYARYFQADTSTLCPKLNADLLDGYHASLTTAASTVPVRDADGLLRLPAVRNSRELNVRVTAAGWYRVFTSAMNDAQGDNILLSVSRLWNLSNNEAYHFSISVRTYMSGYKPCITQLSGTFNTHFITKIRVVQKFDSIFHIDIYCADGINDIVYISGFGSGTFCAPVAATIPDGYTAMEFDTVQGFKCNEELNGNAATATRLQGTYKLWGQDFYGNNVSGSLSGVGSITPAAHNTYDCGSSDNHWNAVRTRQVVCNQAHQLWIWQSTANAIGFATSGTARMMIDASGNVGVGTTSPAYRLDVNGTVRATALRIGEVTISYDAETGMLKFDKGIYSMGDVSALGVNSDTGAGEGPGMSYDRLDAWADYSADKAGYVLSALLGHDLYQNKLGKTEAQSLYQPIGNYLTAHQALDYLNVKDVRGAERLPGYFAGRRMSLWFNNTGTPADGYWWAGFQVKGWDNTYGSWQLCASSHNTATRDKNLYFRVGKDDAWEAWRTILDTSNFNSLIGSGLTAYVKKAGDAMTGPLQITQINDRTGSNALLASKITATGVSATQWLVGPVDAQGVIRSSNASLLHYRNAVGVSTIWDSGNDGAGSGLDADLLDGYHEAVFVRDRDLGSRGDYQHVVFLLWKDSEIANHHIQGKLFTMGGGSIRYQAAAIDIWFSRWSTGYDWKGRFDTWGLGTMMRLVTCTYNGEKWWAVEHTNTQAINLYFTGTAKNVAWTKVHYYTSNTSTVVNSEIYSSREAVDVGTYTVNGIKNALVSDTVANASALGGISASEYLTKSNYAATLDGRYIKKSGDIVAGPLTIQTSVDTKLVFNNTDGEKYTKISFREAGTEYGALVVSNNRYNLTSMPLEVPYFIAGGTTLCPNLNADLLDGEHNGNLTAKLVNYNNDGGISGKVQFMQKSSGWNEWDAPTQTWYSVIKLNHGNGDTYYNRTLAFNFHDSRIHTGRMSGGTFQGWKTLAFLDDNVASATRLATTASFTAWGQIFFANGVPKSIEGNLNGVGDIGARGGAYGNFQITRGLATGEAMRIEPLDANGSWLKNCITMDTDGNLKIGSTGRATHKLHVNGYVRANGLTLDGSHLLEWDAANEAWKFNGNLYATGGLSALGITELSATEASVDTLNLKSRILFNENSSQFIGVTGTTLMISNPGTIFMGNGAMSSRVVGLDGFQFGASPTYYVDKTGEAVLKSLNVRTGITAASVAIKTSVFTVEGTEIYVTFGETKYKLVKTAVS